MHAVFCWTQDALYCNSWDENYVMRKLLNFTLKFTTKRKELLEHLRPISVIVSECENQCCRHSVGTLVTLMAILVTAIVIITDKNIGKHLNLPLMMKRGAEGSK